MEIVHPSTPVTHLFFGLDSELHFYFMASLACCTAGRFICIHSCMTMKQGSELRHILEVPRDSALVHLIPSGLCVKQGVVYTALQQQLTGIQELLPTIFSPVHFSHAFPIC